MSARLFILPHATVLFHEHGALTTFIDGSKVNAQPEDTDDYRRRARDLGYGEDTLALCREHELLHSLAAELLIGGPSPALWRFANGNRSKAGLGQEEDRVIRLQAELRRAGS